MSSVLFAEEEVPPREEKEEEVDHPSAAGVLIVRGGESPDHQVSKNLQHCLHLN